MSSVKKNVIFNYFGQIYIALMGILILPLFLNYMGSESYGLIGFFTLLQSWLQLLDLGMSPTMGREVASLKSNPESDFRLRSVVRSLEFIFSVIAIIIFCLIFGMRELICTEWLIITKLNIHDVSTCIGIVAINICLRWMSSLYRSGINAYEKQVWLNLIDILIVTLRSPFALILMIFTKGNVIYYFLYQLLVVLIEFVCIKKKFYSLLPKIDQGIPVLDIKELRRIAPFALSVAYTGGIWVISTQLDKLLLSKVLTLSEYGYFSLIATLASSLSILSAPISKAILPRMTVLVSQGMEADMLTLYRKASRFIVCLVTPITIILMLFSKDIVFLWTHNANASDWIAPVLPLYVCGNGLLAILAFQYYLQYAYGKLNLHMVYNTCYIIITIPLIFFAVFNYGAIGAGYVWLGCQLVTLFIWMPYVHKVFAPGLHIKWLIMDFLFPLLLNITVVTFFYDYIKLAFSTNSFFDMVLLGLGIAVIVFLISSICFYKDFKRLISNSSKINSFIHNDS
ncbi:oligosaccharide flippase family protein [Enterobacter roggenkampii]|uniref:lipopolysaccharide biosynthesis protein n=1 Tax=Enterobacter roggenkampii TaxID=1812935 RepID=UPI001C6FF9DE|nr:oligosaccharide flippase family protein [Enterobacter roggenkampii]MBW9393713.1 oligosaccharide flippase family protein [Enterobacter roggenkampii]